MEMKISITKERVKRAAKNALLVIATAAAVAAALRVAYQAGRNERFAHLEASNTINWRWVCNTDHGPAYTIDERVGWDGMIELHDNETDNSYLIPLYIW